MALRVSSHGRRGTSESAAPSATADHFADRWFTPGGISVSFRAEPLPAGRRTADPRDLWLHQEYARLSLLRGFDELLCLEGLRGVEHLPHQIETVRKVLRHFRGRVLLADEVGLGKTIEACLLLREYLLRGMARRVLELVQQSQGHKLLIFVNFRRTLAHIEGLLRTKGLAFSVFSGEQTAHEKDEAVAAFRERVPIMLCTESGGEGRNLQFADTLINYDLPWNPMRIEQRVGRVHRFGQTREVFVFNLCTAGSLEARILNV